MQNVPKRGPKLSAKMHLENLPKNMQNHSKNGPKTDGNRVQNGPGGSREVQNRQKFGSRGPGESRGDPGGLQGVPGDTT